jgi:nucleoid-associated protein YgaU
MRRRPAAEIAVLTAIDAVVLVALRPQLGSLERHLAAPRTWVARIGPDQAVATLAAALVWVVAAWLAVGLLATAAGRLPGLAGRTSARLSRALLPRTVHRLIAGSAGLGVLLAPVAAVAKAGPPLASAAGRPAVASAVGRPTVASASSSLPVPSWPVDPPGRPTTPPPTTAGSAQPSPSGAAPPSSTDSSAAGSSAGASTPSSLPTSTRSSLPAPIWPSTGPGSATHSTATRPSDAPSPPAASPNPDGRGSAPGPPAPRPRGSAPPDAPAPRAAPSGGKPVTVRGGESLWLIAARRLGPHASDSQIAAAWPRWYAANRSVIGDDPALIRPGQVLRTPPTTVPNTSPDAEEAAR